MKKQIAIMALATSLIQSPAFAWEANSIQREAAGKVALEKAKRLRSAEGISGVGVESTASFEVNGRLLIGVLVRGHKQDVLGQLDCDVDLYVNEAGAVVPYSQGFGAPLPPEPEFQCALPFEQGPGWNQGG